MPVASDLQKVLGSFIPPHLVSISNGGPSPVQEHTAEVAELLQEQRSGFSDKWKEQIEPWCISMYFHIATLHILHIISIFIGVD